MKRVCFVTALLLFSILLNSAFAQQNLPSNFTSTTLSTGWSQPVGLTFNMAGNQMFVWERAGKIWMVENGVKKLLLDISPEVGAYHDCGMLGFALDPNFDINGYLYLLYSVDRHHLLYHGTASYSSTTNEYYNATIGRLTRYTATKTSTGYTVDMLSRKILIGATKSTGIPAVSSMHHLGSLAFGSDGSLLVCTGDAATSSGVDTGSYSTTYFQQALDDGIITPQENVGAFRSQLLESYNGKILRIDPLTGNGLPSNPFYESTKPSSIRSKVWALGLRNPFRMTLKPGTGSTNMADGNPGVLYLGDVGWNVWEELDVVNKPGMNFGWPTFEGLSVLGSYSNRNVYNYHAPNPLYGINGCTQQYFYFKDLIKEATQSGTATFTNPCDRSQTIPSTVKTFVHSRPIIDWKHGTGPSRTGTFTSTGTATTINIGATGSPVSGPQFGGNCSVGGVFYPHSDFPLPYRNSFFFGDYGRQWVRTISMNTSDQPVSVSNFIDTLARVVAMATNPVEYGLYYISFTSEIRKITYNGSNQPPKAVASSDKYYGPSPLTVQFTGSASSDPEGQPLKYLWDFGDGTSSTLANPSHVFNAPSTAPINYTVKLKVTDNHGAEDLTQLVIFVNNTPPQVTVTSPANNSLYPVTQQSTYALRATVTDKEHTSSQLFYQWQTILRHDDHEHPEPANTNKDATTTLDPLGCGTETYYYRIVLTVTDAGGLATTKEVQLFPYCGKVTSFTVVDATTNKDIQTIQNGSTLGMNRLPRYINIRANTSGSPLGSVVLDLTGTQTKNNTDNTAPFSLFGDTNGDYAGWTTAIGNYTLKGTPFSSSGGSGVVGTGLTINFSIAKKQGTTTQQSAATLQTTIDADRVIPEGRGDFSISYQPNPFKQQFTIRMKNKGDSKLPFKLIDANGRTIISLNDVQDGQTITVDKNTAPGVYFIIVGEEEKERKFKILKVD